MKKLQIALAILALAVAGPALAQKWPDKPVRLVVPYPPGGNVDTAARVLADGLQKTLGQPFVVENRAGAGGMIAGEAVAKSAPDGYTFFVGANGPILYSPLIFGRTPYTWDKDFAPVTSISFTALLVEVNPAFAPKTMKELIDAAKAKPGTITMASPGAGTTNHLVSEMLQQVAGVSWITVHYKGNAPATTDLLGGQVQFYIDQVSVALPHIQAGRIRPLAVTSKKRHPSLPSVPTLEEAGFPGFEAETFTAVMAPRATPREIVDQLSKAAIAVLNEPAVQAKFNALGAEARGSTPEALATYLRKEYDTFAPIIKKANIKAE